MDQQVIEDFDPENWPAEALEPKWIESTQEERMKIHDRSLPPPSDGPARREPPRTAGILGNDPLTGSDVRVVQLPSESGSTVAQVFTAGIALIIYIAYGAFAIAGLGLILFGARAMRRQEWPGLLMLIAGIVLVLIPLLTIASSYLPGQH